MAALMAIASAAVAPTAATDLPAARFGIVGCAEIARKISRAIQMAPNAALVAVGSRSSEKSRRFISDNALDPATITAYGSYEEVMDDPAVDAVYMPLPTSLHLPWAVMAVEKGKHLLLEKPTALCTSDLDKILAACSSAGVQFMDSTMWMHHPRTAAMKQLLSDQTLFGELKLVNSTFTFRADEEFLEKDIRVKPDLDALGALGDVGWYCARAALWAAGFELPKTAMALRGSHVTNKDGVVMSFGACLEWENGAVATLHGSFLAHLTMELVATGTRGTLRLSDFVVPLDESSATFEFSSEAEFNDLVTGWRRRAEERRVDAEGLPQEARMVAEFSRLVGGIRDGALKPEGRWPEISRKTQSVLDALKASIGGGFQPVEVRG